MKLYTVTIRGFKYYFTGNLTPEAITASENFCLKLERNSKTVNTATLFELLIDYIVSELGLSATPVTVEHVFRINY